MANRKALYVAVKTVTSPISTMPFEGDCKDCRKQTGGQYPGVARGQPDH